VIKDSGKIAGKPVNFILGHGKARKLCDVENL
jgi:hypothetical protein